LTSEQIKNSNLPRFSATSSSSNNNKGEQQRHFDSQTMALKNVLLTAAVACIVRVIVEFLRSQIDFLASAVSFC